MQGERTYTVRAAPGLVRTVLEELGWQACRLNESSADSVHMFWDLRRTTLEDLRELPANVRANRVPSLSMLTVKHRLQQHLMQCAVRFPAEYRYFPRGYELPKDLELFKSERRQGSVHICKPTALCAGMDISFITDGHSIDDDMHERERGVRKQPALVCQEYIHPPHLIAKLKYDLRLYVLVTHSLPTLTVWLYDEGLVRFCSRPYSHDWSDRYAHLTNTAINKSRAEGHAEEWASARDELIQLLGPSEPPKWLLAQLRAYLGEQAWAHVWCRIQRLINLTVVPLKPSTDLSAFTFELLGFDVMMDADLEPFLLEVNGNPSLALEALMDVPLKKGLVRDVVELVGLPLDQYQDRVAQGRSGLFSCIFSPTYTAASQPPYSEVV